jgi:hypothetical protein
LRTGTLDAGDDAERHRFAVAPGVGEGLENDISHVTLARVFAGCGFETVRSGVNAAGD